MYVVMKYLVFFLCIGLFFVLIPLTQAYEIVGVYTTGNNKPILDLELSPNEGEVIAADGSLYLLNFYEENVITQGWAATTLDLSDDGTYIVTASDSNICLFTNSGHKIWCHINFPGGAKDITISDDNARIVLGSDTQGSVFLYNLSGERQWVRFVGTPLYRVALSSQLKYVVTTSYLNRFTSYDFSGNLRFDYKNNRLIPYPMYDVAISGDGRYMVGGLDTANQGKIMQFSYGGSILWEYPLDGFARNVVISGNGSFIAAGTQNILDRSGSVYYFSFDQSARNGTLLWNRSVGAYVNCLDMAPDGSYLAVGLRNNHIQLYSQKGYLILDHTSQDRITAVDLSEDGLYLAAGTETGEIYYLDTGILPSQANPSASPSKKVPPTSPTVIAATTTEKSLPSTTEPPGTTSITPIIPESIPYSTQIPESKPDNQSDIFGGSRILNGLIPLGLLFGAFFFLVILQRKER
jgi:WD40 repeat protein